MLKYNGLAVNFLSKFLRHRTSCRKARPGKVKLPPITPLTSATADVWNEFTGHRTIVSNKSYHREDVQAILKRIIGRNPKFIQNINKARSPISSEYRLVRPEDLSKVNAILDRFLKTIPLVFIGPQTKSTLIQRSPEIKNHDTCKYVFTDISDSKNSSNRTILVRYPNGNLKMAPYKIRDRINVVYFGSDTQTYPLPRFLTNEKILKKALSVNKHTYILNYATSVCRHESSIYKKVCPVLNRF